MQHVFYMTDVYGPRLTNSPGLDAAAEWVAQTARDWGLDNVALESWGPFGRGWSTSRFSAHLIEPRYAPLIGVPLAWSPGTAGVLRGTPILAVLRSEDEIALPFTQVFTSKAPPQAAPDRVVYRFDRGGVEG